MSGFWAVVGAWLGPSRTVLAASRHQTVRFVVLQILAKEFVDLRKQRNDLKSPADGTLPADSISLLRHAFVLIAGETPDI